MSLTLYQKVHNINIYILYNQKKFSKDILYAKFQFKLAPWDRILIPKRKSPSWKSARMTTL